MIAWKSDEELFALVRVESYPAVIGDILDELHYYRRFLPYRIQPVEEHAVAAGRAMTVLEADTLRELSAGQNVVVQKPSGLMLEALDDIKEDEVYICTDSSLSCVLVGKLIRIRVQILGAARVVVSGLYRDTRGIVGLDLPCLSYGRYAQDQVPKGKMIDFRVPIEIEGVRVNPRDIVFGDLDDVVVIPRSIEEEVTRLAYEKATGEKMVSEAIRVGMGMKGSFDKHGTV